MCLLSLALILLSLTAGMYLLAKTRNENLGSFFKFISWLIIAGSLAGMLCLAICCLSCSGGNGCYGGGCYGKEQCYSDGDMMEHGHHESDTTVADTTGM